MSQDNEFSELTSGSALHAGSAFDSGSADLERSFSDSCTEGAGTGLVEGGLSDTCDFGSDFSFEELIGAVSQPDIAGAVNDSVSAKTAADSIKISSGVSDIIQTSDHAAGAEFLSADGSAVNDQLHDSSEKLPAADVVAEQPAAKSSKRTAASKKRSAETRSQKNGHAAAAESVLENTAKKGASRRASKALEGKAVPAGILASEAKSSAGSIGSVDEFEADYDGIEDLIDSEFDSEGGVADDSGFEDLNEAGAVSYAVDLPEKYRMSAAEDSENVKSGTASASNTSSSRRTTASSARKKSSGKSSKSSEIEVSTDDPVRQYLHDIGEVPLLKQEEEQSFAQSIEKGNEAAGKLLSIDGFRDRLLDNLEREYRKRGGNVPDFFFSLDDAASDSDESDDDRSGVRTSFEEGIKKLRSCDSEYWIKAFRELISRQNIVRNVWDETKNSIGKQLFTEAKKGQPEAVERFASFKALDDDFRRGAEAKEKLTRANLRLVVSIAKKYTNRGMLFLDLIQEGNLGLIRAVEKFDHTRNFKFSTYATWWIRQAITRALADQGRTIRIPVHMVETINRLSRIKRQLIQELDRDPTPEETAARMFPVNPEEVCKELNSEFERDLSRSGAKNAKGAADGSDKGASGKKRRDFKPITVDSRECIEECMRRREEGIKKIRDIEKIAQDPISLETPIGEEEDSHLGDFIEDEGAVAPVEAATRGWLRDRLGQAVNILSPREREVLEARFGLCDGHTHTLEEVGKMQGVTRERIRQIEAKALRKLRQIASKSELSDF